MLTYHLESEARPGFHLATPCERQTFRGELVTVTGIIPPQHAGSTGRVIVRTETGETRTYFPGVVGARIVGKESRYTITPHGLAGREYAVRVQGATEALSYHYTEQEAREAIARYEAADARRRS